MDVKQSQKAGNNAIQIQQTVVGDNNYVVGIEIENDSRKPNDNQPKRSLLRRLAAFLNDMVAEIIDAFPEWLACIFMVVGLVVTALAAVRLGYGLVVAKTVYKWIVNAEEKFGSGAGAEKKAHVIAVLRGYTPDWLDWAINERTLDWIVQLVFDFTKKKLEDYMAKKSVETTTVARFGKAGEDNKYD